MKENEILWKMVLEDTRGGSSDFWEKKFNENLLKTGRDGEWETNQVYYKYKVSKNQLLVQSLYDNSVSVMVINADKFLHAIKIRTRR